MDNSALFKVGYGLYVLTAASQDGSSDNGCIINTVMQVTSEGKIKFLISVNKNNYTLDMILKSRVFNVSLLTTETPFELIKRFGFQSGRDTDKFDGFKHTAKSENGALYLTEYANAYISFKLLDTVDCDSHTVLVAEVTDAKNLSDKDSLTYDYYHKNIKPKPQPAKSAGWRCKICGYIYEGEELPADFVCPICKHGASDFEKI